MDNKIKLKKYLSDILEFIDAINIHLQGKHDFTLFLGNKTIRRSVEREMEIIGEAMNRILKIQPDIAISSAKRVIDQRNLIIHAYDSVNNEMIWAVIVNHLPLLKRKLNICCHKLLKFLSHATAHSSR